MAFKNIACIADSTKKAQDAYKKLRASNDFVKNPAEADVLLALGGDGFMLHILHKYMDNVIPVYGMNCGTVGFLMNEFREKNILNAINHAKIEILNPLSMMVTTKDGKTQEALAVNEVSLFRKTRQAAHLKISIDNKVRIKELMSDGVLVATPAGSTAYNLSVHGPIIPMGSRILALTPISPFRPRRWRGALLPQTSTIKIEVMESDKRPVSAVADFTEIEDVIAVEIKENREKKIQILFDPAHSLEDRIISEQFLP